MSNLLQQRTLKELVSQYEGMYGLPTHKAFLFLIIEKYLQDLELNSIDIEESIIDGSADCGIDAIVIDEESELRPRIYFFQSKYYIKERAFEITFEGSALEKIQAAINDFILQGKINSSYQNKRLVDKLHSVQNLSVKNPKYTIVLCSNSKEPSQAAKSRLEEFVTETNRTSAGDYLSIKYIHLDRITKEFIAPEQKNKINVDMQISGKYLTEDTGNVRLFVGAIEAKNLVNLVEQHGDDLFERNVRGYLRQNNQVNKGIISTASGAQSPYFVYMNNGLTITCEKFTHAPLQNSPSLAITNAQIVNGQQTARSLHQALREKRLRDDVKVLVRIVETIDPELLMQIIGATNSQTRVTSRDLHSNDEVQKLIEQSLLPKGYFYEARKNKYKGKDSAKRVDAEVAAQAYHSIFSEQPAIAKDKKKLIFGDKYEDLFNETINPDDILYSFRLLKAVQNLNNNPEYSEKFTFLKDSTLHIIALMHRNVNQSNKAIVDLDKPKSLTKNYNEAVKALAQLVKERSQAEGDKYEHRRTFKDPETYGRAVEILIGSSRPTRS